VQAWPYADIAGMLRMHPWVGVILLKGSVPPLAHDLAEGGRPTFFALLSLFFRN
jgi:hypothetical protein